MMVTDPMAEAPPTPEAGAAAVQRHVKRLAEHAFWAVLEVSHAPRVHSCACCASMPSISRTSITATPPCACPSQERLAGSDTATQQQAVEQVVALLADVGSQLAEVLPAGASEAEDVRTRLERAQLLQVLSTGGSQALDLPALLALLDWSATLVAHFGAPARDAAAAAGQAAMHRQLAAAGSDTAAVASLGVRGLRLLATQLKLLRLDAGDGGGGNAWVACPCPTCPAVPLTCLPPLTHAANAHLRLLATQLGAEGAAAFATSKFEAMIGSAQDCALRLPHTRAWLAAASGQLPHVEQMEAALAGQGSTAPVEQATPLPQLRAGLRSSAATSSTSARQARLLAPVACRSWRGLVRLGLVQLVSGKLTVAAHRRRPASRPLMPLMEGQPAGR